MYKLDSDCAKQANTYVAKESQNLFTSLSVIQSKFDKNRGSCLAEFRDIGVIPMTVIYDLTHNKQLIRLNINENEVTNTEQIKEYNEIKNGIFGKE